MSYSCTWLRESRLWRRWYLIVRLTSYETTSVSLSLGSKWSTWYLPQWQACYYCAVMMVKEAVIHHVARIPNRFQQMGSSGTGMSSLFQLLPWTSAKYQVIRASKKGTHTRCCMIHQPLVLTRSCCFWETSSDGKQTRVLGAHPINWSARAAVA